MSLSLGVVNNQARYAQNLDEIGVLVAEAKRHAKLSTDNVFSISSPRNLHFQDRSHKNVTDFPPVVSLMHMQNAKRSAKQDAFVEL